MQLFPAPMVTTPTKVKSARRRLPILRKYRCHLPTRPSLEISRRLSIQRQSQHGRFHPSTSGMPPWAFNGTATQANGVWTASGSGAPTLQTGEFSLQGAIRSDVVTPDAGSPNDAWVLATPDQPNYGFPIWTRLAAQANGNLFLHRHSEMDRRDNGALTN